VGKSGVLKQKSGNISKMHKGRGKVTIDGLQELTNALSIGTIPTFYGLLISKIGGFHPTQCKILGKRVLIEE